MALLADVFFFERENSARDMILDHRSQRVEPEKESVEALLLFVV